jgi:hypothetical protein
VVVQFILKENYHMRKKLDVYVALGGAGLTLLTVFTLLLATAITACTPAQTKNLLPKYQAMAQGTHKYSAPAPFMRATQQTASPVTTTGQSVNSWTDAAGTTYTQTTTTNSTLTYSVPPPTPPTPTAATAPLVDVPSTTVPSALLPPGPWIAQNDPGTGSGVTTGSMKYPVPGMSGANTAREYDMTYTKNGGELFHVSFGKDTTSHYFIYDTYIYSTDFTQAKNVELDMNQVVANGNTVILATQCSGYSNTWEYTTSLNGGTHWNSSNIPCNPTKWTPNKWHHIQIATHHDDNGVVTYDWVGVDGYYSNFNKAAGASSYPLKWAVGTLLINFQLDGANSTSGSISAKMDRTTVYRW